MPDRMHVLLESPGGYRLYGTDHLKRLNFIRRARTLGFRLARSEPFYGSVGKGARLHRRGAEGHPKPEQSREHRAASFPREHIQPGFSIWTHIRPPSWRRTRRPPRRSACSPRERGPMSSCPESATAIPASFPFETE